MRKRWEEFLGETSCLGVGIDVEFFETVLEEAECAADSISPAQPGLRSHDPPVELLAVSVDLHGLLQGCEGAFRVTTCPFQLRQAGQGINRSASQILASRLAPLVEGSRQQVTRVRVRYALEGGRGLSISSVAPRASASADSKRQRSQSKSPASRR